MRKRLRTIRHKTFSALTIRNYRLFFVGQSISLVGTWMQITAQAWLVLSLTHSSTDLGLVVALQ
ncbi:MAG: MFS transporter, partial [Acidimicrobiales bacterium]